MSPSSSSDSDSDSHKSKHKSKDGKEKKKYKDHDGKGYSSDSDEEKRRKKEKKHEHDGHKGAAHHAFQPPPQAHSGHEYKPPSFPEHSLPGPPRFSHPEHGQTPVSVTHSQHPPAYTPPTTIPPAGYRLPLTSTAPFPGPQQAGQPPCFDMDGVSPVYFASAIFQSSVQPCKITPHFTRVCRVPYGGVEYEHNGRYDLLPFTPDTMELVRTSYGQLPPGRRPVEGGYEENGAKLYHAVAVTSGVRVPGKAGEHLGGANVPFGGGEINCTTDYEILCWR